MKTTLDTLTKLKGKKIKLMELGIENSHHASPCRRCARDSLPSAMFMRIYQQETVISVQMIMINIFICKYNGEKGNCEKECLIGIIENFFLIF